MAKLPTVDALPTPRAIGPARINVSTQNGLGTLGQVVTAFGHAMAKEQLKEDTLRAEDAFNRLQQQRLELTQGEDGFSTLKSYDVVSRPLYKEYNERFDAAADEIGKSLSNEDQKKMFRRRVDVSRLQFGTDLTNHIQREKNNYAQEVFKGGKAVELENAASNWDQPGAVKFSIERTRRLIEQQGDREGWAPDVIKAEQMRAQSDIHLSVISQAVSTDNPEYAKEYYGKNKKNIEGTEQPKIEALIRKGGIKVLAQEFTDDVVSRGLDEKAALSEARKRYSGDEENAIVQSVKNRFNEIQQSKENAQKTAGEQAWSIYAETRDVKKVPLDVLQNMKGRERAILEDKAAKDLAGTDFPNGGADYYKLKLMARDNPSEFKKQNPFAYRLSESDRKEIIKIQTEDQTVNYFGSEMFIIDKAAADAGLDVKAKFKTDAKGEQVRKFYNRVKDEQQNYINRNGKPPDDKALTEIVDKLTIKVIKERQSLFDWMNPESLPSWMTEPSIPIWPTTEKITGTIEIEGVPNGMVGELGKALQKTGKPVTEDNIKRLYEYINGR